MKYRLVIKDEISFEELKREIMKGGKFVVYSYCISLIFAVTLKRLSPAFFIGPDEYEFKHKFKYNLISYLFGWWGIPWGPIGTIECLNLNNRGGINVTEDILLNLTKESLELKEVNLEVTNILFDKPDNSDKIAFTKVINKHLINEFSIEKFVVGIFLNTGKDVSPYFVVGLKVKGDFEEQLKKVQKALYKEFLKQVYFKFIDLKNEEEVGVTLIEQGETYI